MVSPKERTIAEAALKPYAATGYASLHAQIAAATGYPVHEVVSVLGNLLGDATLRGKTVQALRWMSSLPRVAPMTEIWYEKGEMWE